MTTETIPLPKERIEAEQNFVVRANDPYAWRDQTIVCDFWYNDLSERWMWKAELEQFGKLVGPSVVNLGVRYSVWPYVLFTFEDRHGEQPDVTTANLGSDVFLCIRPGPLGGEYHPDADISEEEAEQLLRRDVFRA